MFSKLSKSSTVVIFVLCVSLASRVAYEFYYSRKKQKVKINAEVHEVIMFSPDATELKKSKYSRCMITKSMDRLLYYLNSPRHSIDICVYVITNKDITNAIRKLHIRGVKIRVIVDADIAYSNGNSVKHFEKYGIPLRWMKSSNLMHHKFCLIDTSIENVKCTPVVMTGSLNWTNQALNGNWEDVVVTSENKIVRQYQAEFERLWVKFKPIVKIDNTLF